MMDSRGKENAEAAKEAKDTSKMDELPFFRSELPEIPTRNSRPEVVQMLLPMETPKTAVLKEIHGNTAVKPVDNGAGKPASAGHEVETILGSPADPPYEEGSDDCREKRPKSAKPKRIALGRFRAPKLDWISNESETEAVRDAPFKGVGNGVENSSSSDSESSGDEHSFNCHGKAKEGGTFLGAQTDQKETAQKKQVEQEEEPEEGSLEFLRIQSEKAKQGMLAMLNMEEIVADINRPPRKAKQKPKTPKPKKEDVPVEVRRSARLSCKVAPNYSEEKVSSDGAVAQSTEACESRNLGPIMLKGAAQTSMENYEEAIGHERPFLSSTVPPSVDESSVAQFVGKMRGLSMDVGQSARVLGKPITVLDVHVSPDPTLVVVGDEGGSVGFWKIGANSDVFAFRVHQSDVTGLKFNPWQPRKLVSMSHDGVVRLLDLEKKVFELVYGRKNDEFQYSDLDFVDTNSFLVSRSDGAVLLVDLRQKSEVPAAVTHCGADPLKNVASYPADRNYFAVGSYFGNGVFCDRRCDREFVSQFRFSRPASSVAFNATGSRLTVVSAADTISIYDSANLTVQCVRGEEFVRPCLRWTHKNQTKSLAGFNCAWHPSREDCFLTGSMDTMRNIELWKTNGSLLHLFTSSKVRMSTCTIVKFHPSKDMVLGADNRGKICYFQ